MYLLRSLIMPWPLTQARLIDPARVHFRDETLNTLLTTTTSRHASLGLTAASAAGGSNNVSDKEDDYKDNGQGRG